MNPIRLLLVDDHVLFRESLRRLLASEGDLDVVADVGTTRDALEVMHRTPIDVVLLDFDLGSDHGGEVVAASRRGESAAKVLMVTAGMSAAESATALRLGASGIFLKHGSPVTLVQAIRLVAGGAMWVDQHVIHELTAQIDQVAARPRPHLTEREHQVIQGVFEGLANKEIGVRIGVSESAVKSILQQLFRKTNVRTRSQLVRVALEGSFSTVRRT